MRLIISSITAPVEWNERHVVDIVPSNVHTRFEKVSHRATMYLMYFDDYWQAESQMCQKTIEMLFIHHILCIITCQHSFISHEI